MIGYLDKTIKFDDLILPKMSEYVKTLKIKVGDKDKNNQFMLFYIDDKKLLKNIKPFELRLKT